MLSKIMEFLQENIAEISTKISNADYTDESGKIFREHNHDREIDVEDMRKHGVIEVAKYIVMNYYGKTDGQLPSKAEIANLKVYRRTWCVTRKTFDADISWEW